MVYAIAFPERSPVIFGLLAGLEGLVRSYSCWGGLGFVWWLGFSGCGGFVVIFSFIFFFFSYFVWCTRVIGCCRLEGVCS